MSTIQQDEFYYTGTVGFPIRITLLDKTNAPLVLDSSVQGIKIDFTRSDKTVFSRNLSTGVTIYDINGGIIQYVTQTGDLTVPGTYEFLITLTFTNNRILPLKGTMKVL